MIFPQQALPSPLLPVNNLLLTWIMQRLLRHALSVPFTPRPVLDLFTALSPRLANEARILNSPFSQPSLYTTIPLLILNQPWGLDNATYFR